MCNISRIENNKGNMSLFVEIARDFNQNLWKRSVISSPRRSRIPVKIPGPPMITPSQTTSAISSPGGKSHIPVKITRVVMTPATTSTKRAQKRKYHITPMILKWH